MPPNRNTTGFTLVELLIVVVILGILAAVVVPQFSDASEDAQLSRLSKDLRATRTAIAIYKVEHSGRHPMYDENGDLTPPNGFRRRLTERTDKSGTLTGVGAYGPYLSLFPINPYKDDPTQANHVNFNTTPPPSGPRGWHLNTDTGRFSANTSGHENL